MKKLLALVGPVLAAGALFVGVLAAEDARESAEDREVLHQLSNGPVMAWLDGKPFRDEHLRDDARVLGPFAATVSDVAGLWLDQLGIDMQVRTVRAADQSIAELANQLFEQDRIGANAATGGMLLLIDAEGSRARIEVSYELEGAFPDLTINRMVTEQLAPYASYSMAGMAAMDVVQRLKEMAFVRVANGQLTLPDDVRERDAFRKQFAHLSGGAGAQAAIPMIASDAELKRYVPEPDRTRYAPNRDPLASVAAYARVLRDLAGDPTLPLFAPSGVVQRERYPMAPLEDQVRHRRLRASEPLHAIVHGDRAVVRSRTPAPGFVPILLRRIDGLWRIDIAMVWQTLFWDRNGEYAIANPRSPYRFGLKGLGVWERRGLPKKDRPFDLAPVSLGEESPSRAIARLEAQAERRPDAATHMRAGEILYRNCFIPQEAMRHYEKAAELAPDDLAIAHVIAQRSLYTFWFAHAIPYLQKLGPIGYERLAYSHWRAGNDREAYRIYRRALRMDPDSKTISRALRALREKARSTG